MKQHEEKSGIATIAAYYEKDPSSKGIIAFDENLKIFRFIEKPAPKDIISNYANAGIYAMNERIFEHLKEMSKEDLQMKKDHLTKKLALIDKMIKEMK